jgi:16S rRNA (guanine527-N7)-methyltransferase
LSKTFPTASALFIRSKSVCKTMSESPNPPGTRLNELLAEAAQPPLDPAQTQRFAALYSLFVRWSTRINLSAIRDQESILKRHFVESIACARALPAGISTLLDFGSGAGFPGLPIALCRPEIAVTLAESQGKKAAFLREAVRVLGVTTLVHSGRAESLTTRFDCVTLRAVDKMDRAVQSAAKLVRPGGRLALMTTTAALPALQSSAGADFSWTAAPLFPGNDDRQLALGKRALNSPS